MQTTRKIKLLTALFAALLSLLAAALQPTCAAGVTDTEIRIGNVMPYTGPLAAFGSIGRAEAACFDMINERGGINGRSAIVLPGIAINTGPADFHPIKQMRLVQFDGNARQPIGDVIESAFASRPNDN